MCFNIAAWLAFFSGGLVEALYGELPLGFEEGFSCGIPMKIDDLQEEKSFRSQGLQFRARVP